MAAKANGNKKPKAKNVAKATKLAKTKFKAKAVSKTTSVSKAKATGKTKSGSRSNSSSNKKVVPSKKGSKPANKAVLKKKVETKKTSGAKSASSTLKKQTKAISKAKPNLTKKEVLKTKSKSSITQVKDLKKANPSNAAAKSSAKPNKKYVPAGAGKAQAAAKKAVVKTVHKGSKNSSSSVVTITKPSITNKKRKSSAKHKPIKEPVIPLELAADPILHAPELLPAKKPVKTSKKITIPEKKTRRESGSPVSKGVTIPDRFDDPLPSEVMRGKVRSKRFNLEFSINSATHILFNYISTSSGLKEWFADDVIEKGDLFTFFWEGSSQVARLVSLREDHHVRFHWLDRVDGTYFEFRLERDLLTDDLALVVIDFFEEGESEETARLLWESQIESLFKIIGAHS